MDIILNGIITGLLLSVLVGATFFMLIETSMTRGFKAALWFDTGVVLCDTMLITLVYFFTSWINDTIVRNEYFKIAGGIVFMAFGINYILSRKRNNAEPVALAMNLRLFLNGFLINLMNPSVILFWLGTMAITLSNFKYSGRETVVYYSAAVITMTLFDILKAYFAYKISHFINDRILRTIYILSGVLMFILGLYIILK
jgi:threonine/homoserine/homoserine lactone efflux protein